MPHLARSDTRPGRTRSGSFIESQPRGASSGRNSPRRKKLRRRRLLAVAGIAVLLGGVALLSRGDDVPPAPEEIPGSTAWAYEHYGDPDARRFKARNIVTIDFLDRKMFVHRKVQRHFLRLARLFEARAPEYAAAVATGELDDWSYENRAIRGAVVGKSLHAFGLAVDVNALSNVLGTAGDMPMEVVRQWEIEGGDWGGDWSRPDPMHFETHLTPAQIRARYEPDGSPTEAYLRELVGD